MTQEVTVVYIFYNINFTVYLYFKVSVETDIHCETKGGRCFFLPFEIKFRLRLRLGVGLGACFAHATAIKPGI